MNLEQQLIFVIFALMAIEPGANVNNGAEGWISRLSRHLRRGIWDRLWEIIEPNPGLKKITLYGAKICLGGNIIKGVLQLFVDMNGVKVPTMLLVAEITSMGGLVACVGSVLLWKKYTRAVDILAKIGCTLTVAAASSMVSVNFSGIYALLFLLIVVGFTAPFIWKA